VFAEYFRGCEGLAYALSSKLAEGNICIDIENYKEDLPYLLEKQKARPGYKDEYTIFWPSAEEFEKQCNQGKYVSHSSGELKPFIIQGKKAYLHRYYQYETQIIDNIKRLGKNFHIITGGPGTGKTFSIGSRLVEEFTRNPGLRVALAAPTGKASARMNEALKEFAGKQADKIEEAVKAKITDLKAQTIHRLLGFKKDSVFFNYDEKNRLPFDMLIVDECSMVDGSLMAKLLNAVDGNTNLWLIGDKDQLASVEAGSVFGDLCRAEKSAVLNGKVDTKVKNWRFDPDKGIGRLSREVIEGRFSGADSYSGDEKVTIVILESDNKKENLFREKVLKSEYFRQYASLYQEYIYKESVKEALASLNKVRFLCVTRENDYSVAEVNKAVEKYLRSIIRDNERFNPREGFYHNQPVIITKNDYNLRVFNGDVGLIRKEGDTFLAWFETTEGEIRNIPAGYLNHYDTVFAMTVHKSQGSEFENVVVLLPEKQGEQLLTRELLYTGVTRAINRALIQTTEETLLKCSGRTVSRASGLEDRLNNEK
jgi:exodeoxyribonuclease V alpha subunit